MFAGPPKEKDSVDELLLTIRAARQNQAYLSPHLVAQLIERIAELSKYCGDLFVDVQQRGQIFDLTMREREVVELLIARHGRMKSLMVELGPARPAAYEILLQEDFGRRQLRRLEAWLGQELAQADN